MSLVCPTCQGSGLVPQPLAPLTVRQREILDFVGQYIADHRVAPTFREISERFALNHSTVHEHLEHLARKGFVRRSRNQVRGLVLVESTP